MALGGRIASEAVLSNPQRVKLLGAISASPGIHLREAQRQTGLAWGELVHHIRLLEHASLVHRRSAGTRTHLFAAKSQPQEPRQRLGTTTQRVLREVGEQDGASTMDVVAALDISDRLARYHLSRLVKEEYVVSDKSHPPCYRTTQVSREKTLADDTS